MKKLFALLLALTMVFSLATTAFAEETATTYSITINNSATGHTYEAYQIFTGDLSNGTLSNIVWGSNISEAGKTALQTKYAAANDQTAAGVAAALTNDNAKAFAKDVAGYLTGTAASSGEGYVISGLAAGYYLVKDQDDSLDGDNDSYTSYILEVTANETVTPKASTPSVVKKVKDINNSTDTAMSDWQDSADHDIGDNVPFKLTATLANNVSAYNTYKIIFNDTLSSGLTYDNNAKVYFGSTEVTSSFTITHNNGTLTISCDNVKAFGATDSSVITVEYTATLNENAVIGSAGNPNVVNLEFSNNPNWDGTGDEDTGKTPDDKVIVFTYKLVVNKTDSDGNALTGADFKLEKKNQDGTWTQITLTKSNKVDGETTVENCIFSATGLDDGTYKITETATPAGYNSIDPIEFTVTAGHDTLSDNPALTSLTGTATTGEITFTADTTAGSLSTNIVNKAGTELPETGGMGTTLFYIVGGIMVVAAVVLLVTKKRMGAEA